MNAKALGSWQELSAQGFSQVTGLLAAGRGLSWQMLSLSVISGCCPTCCSGHWQRKGPKQQKEGTEVRQEMQAKELWVSPVAAQDPP